MEPITDEELATWNDDEKGPLMVSLEFTERLIIEVRRLRGRLRLVESNAYEIQGDALSLLREGKQLTAELVGVKASVESWQEQIQTNKERAAKAHAALRALVDAAVADAAYRVVVRKPGDPFIRALAQAAKVLGE